MTNLGRCRKCGRPAVAILYRPHNTVDETATFCEVCVDHALATGWMDGQALDNYHDEARERERERCLCQGAIRGSGHHAVGCPLSRLDPMLDAERERRMREAAPEMYDVLQEAMPILLHIRKYSASLVADRARALLAKIDRGTP